MEPATISKARIAILTLERKTDSCLGSSTETGGSGTAGTGSEAAFGTSPCAGVEVFSVGGVYGCIAGAVLPKFTVKVAVKVDGWPSIVLLEVIVALG